MPPHTVHPFDPATLSQRDAVLLWWDAGATHPTADAWTAVRRAQRPLIALCASPDEQAAALYAGADAACGLAPRPTLLRALVTAYHRHHASADALTDVGPAVPPRDTVVVGPIRLDRRARTCAVGADAVTLTLKEFNLLDYLMHNAGACCTRDELLEHVWGLAFDPGSNSVDVFVYTLRRKLKARGLAGVIQTVRGVGYRLTSPAPSTS